MNADSVAAALRHEARTLAWPGEILTALPRVTRRMGATNMVTAYDLDEAGANEAIGAEIAFFAGRAQSFEWKAFSFDEPRDLVARLRVAGFEIDDREAVVVYDLADGLGPFRHASNCEVRRIEREEDLADFKFVAEAAFDKDYAATIASLAAALRTGDRGHGGYVATMEGKPAAVGRLYTHSQSAFAGLSGGGTLPEYRGRGLYRAVVAARAHDAAARGARYLQVDALPTSLPILLQMGFAHVADTWPCASPAPR